MYNPFDGTNIHWTFVYIRLTLTASWSSSNFFPDKIVKSLRARHIIKGACLNKDKKYSVGQNAGMKLNASGGIEIHIAAEQSEGETAKALKQASKGGYEILQDRFVTPGGAFRPYGSGTQWQTFDFDRTQAVAGPAVRGKLP